MDEESRGLHSGHGSVSGSREPGSVSVRSLASLHSPSLSFSLSSPGGHVFPAVTGWGFGRALFLPWIPHAFF